MESNNIGQILGKVEVALEGIFMDFFLYAFNLDLSGNTSAPLCK